MEFQTPLKEKQIPSTEIDIPLREEGTPLKEKLIPSKEKDIPLTEKLTPLKEFDILLKETIIFTPQLPSGFSQDREALSYPRGQRPTFMKTPKFAAQQLEERGIY